MRRPQKVAGTGIDLPPLRRHRPQGNNMVISKRLPFIHAHKLGNFCGFETKNHRAGHIF
jgi:hypothetical protein